MYTIYIYFSKNVDEEISQKAIVGLGKFIVTKKNDDDVLIIIIILYLYCI